MRGVITAEINEREYPSVDARVLGFYKEGAVVDIVQRVEGDEYDGESLWFKLTNGNFLWSGGVNTEPDCSTLPLADRRQFFMCYRKTENGAPVLNTTIPSDNLTVTALTLPVSMPQIRVAELPAEDFAAILLQSMRELGDDRKHVMIYIHGYQLMSSLKLDLYTLFVQSYMVQKNNQVAKTIFFSWPSQGSPARKTVDDRSVRAGQQFTEQGHFEYFATLAKELNKAGKKLNLLVHSFGHQLLNGMLNPSAPVAIPENVFENVFLMASDVTHLVLQSDRILLKNYYMDDAGQSYEYGYSQLTKIAKNIHVFYDEDDFLLYASTKKFVEKGLTADATRIDEVRKYRSLGNYGGAQIPSASLCSGFTFWSIQDLYSTDPIADINDYPFQPAKKRIAEMMKSIRETGNYSGINALRILFNAGRFANHHRYLFTCKPVVEKVQELLALT